ncbi:MAG: allene oxide cyclase family protein [Caldilineaceae bacterium]
MKLLLAAGALVLPVLLAGVLSGCAPSVTQTITYVEHADTDAVGDVAPEGDSVGDTLGFANPVYDADNQVQVGTDNGSCIRTAAGEAWECIWTLILPDGQITVEGPFYDAKDSMMAVTGGTDAYREVRGQMLLHSRNDQGSEFDFTYTLILPPPATAQAK